MPSRMTLFPGLLKTSFSTVKPPICTSKNTFTNLATSAFSQRASSIQRISTRLFCDRPKQPQLTQPKEFSLLMFNVFVAEMMRDPDPFDPVHISLYETKDGCKLICDRPGSAKLLDYYMNKTKPDPLPHDYAENSKEIRVDKSQYSKLIEFLTASTGYQECFRMPKEHTPGFKMK